MKKAGRKSTTEAQKQNKPGSVDEYFAHVPMSAREPLSKIREAIRSAAPAEATEVISYGIPAFKHNKVLVWYAAFSDHCSLFPTASVIAAFKDELKAFSIARGTIHFPLEKPVPVALIKKLVKARVAEVVSKEV